MAGVVEERITTELHPGVRGPIISRSDAGYDAARGVYNAMIDRRPEAVVRCQDVADVMASAWPGSRGATIPTTSSHVNQNIRPNRGGPARGRRDG